MRRFAAALLAVLTAGSLACNESIIPTDPGDVGPVSRTEVFTGTLSPGESSFYSITNGAAGTIAVTFASARVVNTSTTLAPSMAIGFGVPRGTDCQVSQTANATPGLQAQVRTTIDPGIFCVRIADTGSLTQPIDFAVRLTFPLEPTASTPANETFNSLLIAGGSSARTFLVPSAGTYSITLADAPTAVGMSIGIPEFLQTGCLPMQTLTATANSGAQFSGNIDPGVYCLRVFDIGGISTSINFSINIAHP